MAEKYVNAVKISIKITIGMVSIFDSIMGNNSMPDPIAVPANKKIALSFCLIISVPSFH
jgi:hypothetical protein